MILVTINTITSGASPFDIWVCDTCYGTCQYIDTITSAPYTFTLPTLFETYPSYIVKIVDFNDCTYCITPVDAGKQFQDGEFFDFMDGTRYEFQ
jgi:hypothetical protein